MTTVEQFLKARAAATGKSIEQLRRERKRQIADFLKPLADSIWKSSSDSKQ